MASHIPTTRITNAESIHTGPAPVSRDSRATTPRSDWFPANISPPTRLGSNTSRLQYSDDGPGATR